MLVSLLTYQLAVCVFFCISVGDTLVIARELYAKYFDAMGGKATDAAAVKSDAGDKREL